MEIAEKSAAIVSFLIANKCGKDAEVAILLSVARDDNKRH
jgi:hypothetical protein